MNILINDVPISFELESEQNIGEVVTGLTRWLTESGHHLDEVALDGRVVAPEEADGDHTWRKAGIDTVETLSIRASSVHQLTVDQLETIINYTDLLRRVAAEGSAEQLQSVLEELPYVTEAIDRITPDLAGLLDEPLADSPDRSDHVRAALSRRAGEMSRLIGQRQRELLEPEHELRHTVTALKTMLPAIEAISTQLQTGKEREALEMVARFAELAGRLLRILPIAAGTNPSITTDTVGDRSMTEVLSTLPDLFRELEEAMSGGDLVLVGDLMEYELLPQFADLSATLTRTLAIDEATDEQNR